MTGEQATTESYGAGVRRRLRDGALTFGSALLMCVAIYVVYGVSRSTPLALGIAVLCGVGTERIVGSVSPIIGIEDISRSGRALWLTLMGPCLFILAAILVLSSAQSLEGAALIGAILIAWLFGCIASATHRVFAGKASA